MTSIANKTSETNVGVDVGKFQLDIYIRPANVHFGVTNDVKGIQEAIKQLVPYKPARIIVEATGRLENHFICACAKANLPFVLANPVHIKKFAGAIGQLAKTDKLDAKLIARYGEVIQPAISQVKPEIISNISDLLLRRNQLIKMQTMEKIACQSCQRLPKNRFNPFYKRYKKRLPSWISNYWH